ncbi:unnamed protein product [Rotaria sp. Silwood1]|nr:unnamed protein product [Rotaria sp. Silwood1]
MIISNADIERSMNAIKILPDINEIVSKSLQLWKDTKRTNKHYSNLLNLIDKLNSWYSFDKSSVFDISNDQSVELDQPSISNASKHQSDQSAIFEVIKDEIEKLFDL